MEDILRWRRYLYLLPLIGIIILGMRYYADFGFSKVHIFEYTEPVLEVAERKDDNLGDKTRTSTGLVKNDEEKIRLDVSSESSARQRIHIKSQALFSSKELTDAADGLTVHDLQVNDEQNQTEKDADMNPKLDERIVEQTSEIRKRGQMGNINETTSRKRMEEINKTINRTGIKKTTEILNRERVERVLRNTITKYHFANFIKPENESCKRRLPICILIGVPKSGTREIMDFMRLHPHIEIYHRVWYENYYFTRDYHKGRARFRSQMPCSYSNQITVMKNAWYFPRTNVPERIKNFNESMKLILLVREPVSRAVSHLSWQTKSPVSSDNFERMVIRGNTVKSNDIGIFYSVYDRPMKKWLQYFHLDQFLIIESNELKVNPAAAMTKVEDFLGLQHYITPEMFVFNEEKGFFCVRSNLSVSGMDYGHATDTQTGATPVVSKSQTLNQLPGTSQMACYADNRGREPINVAPSTISKLKEYFRPKNKRFFEMIGKTFDWN